MTQCTCKGEDEPLCPKCEAAVDSAWERYKNSPSPTSLRELTLIEKQAAADKITGELSSRPVLFPVYPLHGIGFTSAPKKSAQIIYLDSIRKERTNGPTRPPKRPR